jgi:hypothetical protein
VGSSRFPVFSPKQTIAQSATNLSIAFKLGNQIAYASGTGRVRMKFEQSPGLPVRRQGPDISIFSVTAQVGWMAHGWRRDFAEFEGSRVRASMMFQPCFLAVEKKERMSAESIAPSNERKLPEIFDEASSCALAFGLIVGEGNRRIAKEAQRRLFACCEAQEEFVCPLRRGARRRRLPAPFMAARASGAWACLQASLGVNADVLSWRSSLARPRHTAQVAVSG